MKSRINNLIRRMDEENLDGLLISDLTNLRYLIGYTGDNGLLLLSKGKALFFTDFRYAEQSKREIRNAKIKIRERDLFSVFPIEFVVGMKRLGFEAENISYQNYQRLKKQIKKTKLVPCGNWTKDLRAIKDEMELNLIRKAAEINDKIFALVLRRLKPGLREREIANEIEYEIRCNGGELAFPPIVAGGRNGALPHYQPGMKKLKFGEPVVIDFGTKYQGYCSDMTRTVFIGRASRYSKKIYSIVLEAQLAALAMLKPGEKASVVDASARDFITKKGYGKYFGHSLGHGVGLLVHENPALAKTSQAILAENNVITVEPGIYLPEWGGVRIEDLVRITPNGYEILSKSPKELIEI